ncbi:low molecular weight phosphatase family protein [Microbacteriaceae bacterium 4G12]
MTEATGQVFTILTVCTGNICRSPLAEYYLRSRLAELGDVQVRSAGTLANDGDRAPAQAEALAKRYGVDVSVHRATYLGERQLRDAQLVLALAREHRSAVVRTLPKASRTAFTLREFARLAEGLTNEDLGRIALLPADDVAGRLSALVALVGSRRGVVAPAATADDDEVIDPYKRSDATYALSGEQLIPAADAVADILLRAARIRPDGAVDTTIGASA